MRKEVIKLSQRLLYLCVSYYSVDYICLYECFSFKGILTQEDKLLTPVSTNRPTAQRAFLNILHGLISWCPSLNVLLHGL